MHPVSLTARFGEICHHQNHGEIERDKTDENADIAMPMSKIIAILLILLND